MKPCLPILFPIALSAQRSALSAQRSALSAQRSALTAYRSRSAHDETGTLPLPPLRIPRAVTLQGVAAWFDLLTGRLALQLAVNAWGARPRSWPRVRRSAFRLHPARLGFDGLDADSAQWTPYRDALLTHRHAPGNVRHRTFGLCRPIYVQGRYARLPFSSNDQVARSFSGALTLVMHAASTTICETTEKG
jgi:hypothetical protein